MAEQLKNNGFLSKKIFEPQISELQIEDLPVEPPIEGISEKTPEPDKEAVPVEEEEKQAGIIDLGYGWYQLPDGRKVRKSQIDGEN